MLPWYWHSRCIDDDRRQGEDGREAKVVLGFVVIVWLGGGGGVLFAAEMQEEEAKLDIFASAVAEMMVEVAPVDIPVVVGK